MTSQGRVAFSQVMRNVVVAVLLLLTAACGAYQFPPGSSGGTGTVTGSVVVYPCAPVESVDNPCRGRSIPGLEIDFASGNTTKAAVTDSTGHYAIDLDAGTWKARIKSYMRIMSGPVSVNVTAGSTVIADYVVDSGIRVPVPAPAPGPPATAQN